MMFTQENIDAIFANKCRLKVRCALQEAYLRNLRTGLTCTHGETLLTMNMIEWLFENIEEECFTDAIVEDLMQMYQNIISDPANGGGGAGANGCGSCDDETPTIPTPSPGPCGLQTEDLFYVQSENITDIVIPEECK